MGFNVGAIVGQMKLNLANWSKGKKQVVNDIADLKKKAKLAKFLDQETAAFEKFFKKHKVGMLGAIAVTGLFAKKSIELSSDAEEISSKFDTVYESIQNVANATALDLSDSFKLASSTSKKLLSDTGDLLVGFGFTESMALDLSKRVNELAIDTASFSNYAGGATGASEALTKALLGETESAKSLGIVIRQDTKEFRDQINYLVRTKGYTEQQAKAVEILDESYRQSRKAVGDFSRTQDSFANVTRITSEKVKTFSETLGDLLKPNIKAITIAFGEGVEAATKFLKALKTDMQLSAQEKQLQFVQEFIAGYKEEIKLQDELKKGADGFSQKLNDLTTYTEKLYTASNDVMNVNLANKKINEDMSSIGKSNIVNINDLFDSEYRVKNILESQLGTRKLTLANLLKLEKKLQDIGKVPPPKILPTAEKMVEDTGKLGDIVKQFHNSTLLWWNKYLADQGLSTKKSYKELQDWLNSLSEDTKSILQKSYENYLNNISAQSDAIKTQQEEINNAIKNAYDLAQEELKQSIEEMAGYISGYLNTLFSDMQDFFTNSKSGFKSFEQAIGSSFKKIASQIVSDLLRITAQIIAMKVASSFFPGIGNLFSFIGSKASGGMLPGSVTGTIPSAANGMTFDRPTLAVIGDSPAGPERVLNGQETKLWNSLIEKKNNKSLNESSRINSNNQAANQPIIIESSVPGLVFYSDVVKRNEFSRNKRVL